MQSMTVLDLSLEGCYFFVQFTGFGSKTVKVGLVLDMDKLRSEPGTVNGIGEKRREQIMEIIQRNIAEADSQEAIAESVKK